ncbi:MAG: hypothetical protein JXB05_13595 [Myxococcaceae bacterium]|nr:hypothetical protein [Myxococcaceae bacterium]
MANLLNLAVEQVAQRWVSDLPGGAALAPVLREGLRAVISRPLQTLTRGGDKTVDLALRGLFQVPAELRDPTAGADHIGRILHAWIPEHLRSLGTVLDRLQGAPQTVPEPEDASGAPEPVSRLLAQLRGRIPGVNADSVLSRVRGALSLQALATGPLGPGDISRFLRSGRYNPERVIQTLRELLLRLSPGQVAMNRVLAEMLAEAKTLPFRLGVAGTVATLELVKAGAPVPRSNLMVGNYICTVLQTNYIKKLGGPDLIVAERTVYGLGLRRRPLARAAAEESNWDLTALRMARLSPFSGSGELRDDLIDFGRMQMWEIKPTLSAPVGVMQEFYYRHSYNIWAAFWGDVIGNPIRRSRLMGGEDWDDFARGVLAQSTISGPSGGTIKPFCLDALPGLVLYWFIQGLTPEQVALLQSALMAALLALLKQAADKIKGVKEAIEKALETAMKFLQQLAESILQVLVQWGLAIAMVVAAVALLAAGAVTAPAGAVLLAGSALFIFWSDAGKESPERPEERAALSEEPDKAVTLDFGQCRLVNFPARLLPVFGQKVGSVMSEGLAAAVEAISRLAVPEGGAVS